MTGKELSFREPDPWTKRTNENSADYAAFIEYCKLGPKRTLRLLAFRVGTTDAHFTTLSRKHEWKQRALAYDDASQQLVPGADALDAEETNVFHYAVGKALLDLGIRALELKNPGSIQTKDAIKLVTSGVEAQRKALGQDQGNIRVTFNQGSVDKLNELLIEIDESEIEEEVDEDG